MNYQDSPLIALVNLINNVAYNQNANPEQNIIKLLEKNSKQQINLIYDGLSFCQLTGNVIGNQQMIKLKIKEHIFNVLQTSLKDLIQNHCFVDGRFEKCFSIINNVQFILQGGQNTEFTNKMDLEITDDILKQVYGEEKFVQMMEEIRNFYKENNALQQCRDQNLLMKCPKTQKDIILFSDGINLQSVMYSIEGALKVLSDEKDKLFEHQINFLVNYKDKMRYGIYK
ncbi:unnamed protein product [Paramecium sonneborni]|uniref:Uncharacterized protein n=1 Tax=Paramecium sonneborni TaxID=65129 RepID=A0A8S1LW98_9CILI|nr:unnamed protein product [Paramecium sonneborni]